MRIFVEKLAKAIKERGVGNKYCVHVDGFKISIYEAWDGRFLELVNPEYVKGDLKIYEDEYDLLDKVMTDCQQKTEDALIEQLNNL